jgi:hypothetical protein
MLAYAMGWTGWLTRSKEQDKVVALRPVALTGSSGCSRGPVDEVDRTRFGTFRSRRSPSGSRPGRAPSCRP